ncbi:formyltetrahydrofolate deformylase [Pacificimonas sp. WHA3]|uniref:Formyltetrahydrofolate deformylase n=1 Tax=Pacificimonas pallii TaxID=2827236 RepID=A0ABS6SCN3_9SPHN|nr:formyltetrahydrofolate deformylase [Pacificimonas pallii]MBV7255686.1 formyltetrahydrofolate deformylase [Pacificimonas pallii]
MDKGPAYILLFSCRDSTGIVAAVSGALADHDGFILDSQQYADLETGRFFMRVEFQTGGTAFPNHAGLKSLFAPIAERFGWDWSLTDAHERPKAVVAVSKGTHCLNDLLHRQHSGMLGMEIAAIVSNHDVCREIAEWHGLSYHHLPVSNDNRPAQEAAIRAVMDDVGAPYLVLARYMQVLSNDMSARLPGRCINIHHSFLPGFKGARPYHQAHARGVKLIGATAHFVTADLDEGPIIEQSVERVDHRASPEQLARFGRDIEAQTLARAVDWIGDRRVLLNGARTIVFR